jgi:hypothetical protein
MTDITTDHKWKQFKYGYEVPEKVLAEQFDWLEDDEKTDGFIRYRKYWYHVSEFLKTPKDSNMTGWDGYSPDSAFSAVMLQVSNDGEEYKIGTFIS